MTGKVQGCFDDHHQKNTRQHIECSKNIEFHYSKSQPCAKTVKYGQKERLQKIQVPTQSVPYFQEGPEYPLTTRKL